MAKDSKEYTEIECEKAAKWAKPLSIIDGHALESADVVSEEHLQAEDILTEPDHATPGHGGQCCILQILYLEHDTHLPGNEESAMRLSSIRRG